MYMYTAFIILFGYLISISEIAKTMTQSLHFNTYGGNPLSCAAGSAVLDVSYNIICSKSTMELHFSFSPFVHPPT